MDCSAFLEQIKIQASWILSAYKPVVSFCTGFEDTTTLLCGEPFQPYPVTRDSYQRLLASHKPKKLAIIPCTRKLLVILDFMLKHRSS